MNSSTNVKPRKLPNGNWNVRVFEYRDENGKAHYKSFTARTKYEVQYMAADYIRDNPPENRGKKTKTLGQAIDDYIALSEGLSPTSISSYEYIRRYAFKGIMDIPLTELTEDMCQIAINDESKRITRKNKQISPKTVMGYWGLCSTVICRETGKRFNVKLPKLKPKFIELPEPKQIADIVCGTEIELPCLIAMCLSFTMSEIRGIKFSSIKNGCIYINQVVVDVNGVPTVKEQAKVPTRNRKLKIPPYIAERIEKNEIYQECLKDGVDRFLFPQRAYIITNRFKRMMKENGIKITFHGLRHVNASVMLALNVPTKYAMERGGWKTDSTLKTVYQHTFSSEREIVDNKIDEYFEEIL